jgi:glutathione peroxidase
MFAKSGVKGPNANPLFKLLAEKTKTTPQWNFYKYLLDQDGNVVTAFSSLTSPESKTITSQIEKLLAKNK